MQDDLNEILNHQRIRLVLERYCRGIDRLDADALASVYWDDAHDNHGIYNGPAPGFAEFIIPYMRDHWTSTTHMIGQSNIEVAGNRAAAETVFIAHHIRPDGDGIADDVAGGRYADVLECRDGEWRLLDRVVVMDWVYTHAGLASSAIDPDVFVIGQRDAADFGYQPYGRLRD
ncbi:nuclear transport factor 2 family protein [Sphingopyxis sp. BSN-002]|uniref:nuclear transport factor 2 family protein n=1 Tax=Sphingopyxis sp. BSN-002 TaxID=2911495 RepID=UPI001EDBB4DF|nr:nuclear transport factor 2 family protein [Sphingopyxis sp. BSN-002]UKK84083.1 nuclear transport factor 2 family protein [Sphingopyxis sp. BSN-002]